ncbi:GNAT family N-acetyltransferase [Shewanella algae]|uniref:GNAT family N-acetyltransferase n=1 Tax=Shewanella algae TaxID=38313 RepID=UPI001C55D9AD|nr:GNAT family N-acetyltransferase [Shewanella algae]
MKVSIIADRDEFYSIKHEWEELYFNSRNRNPFLHHDWILNTIDLLLHQKQIKIVLVRTNQKVLIGACPFVIEEKKVLWKKIKVLRHLNCIASDYSDLLVSSSVGNRDIVKKITEAVFNFEFDMFQIDNLNSASATAKLFMKFLTEKSLTTSRYVNVVNPILSYSEMEYSDKKGIKDIQRRLKNLSKDNDVSFHIDDAIDKDAWNKLVMFHKHNYPGFGFNSSQYQGFYNRLLNSEGFKHDFIDFSYMKINNVVVAAHFGFVDLKAGTVYYYVPSFDNEYAKYGVGKILLLKLIEYYKDQGCTTFDFMRGSEAYKTNWMSDELQNFSIVGCKRNSSLFSRYYVRIWSLAKTAIFLRRGY